MNAKQKRFGYLSALIAPAIIVVLATILSLDVAERFRTELLSRFESDAETALKTATNKLDNYRDLLYGGRAFVLSSEEITAGEWKSYYNQQAVFERYPGVSSISYVNNVSTAELAAFEARMQQPEYFGPTYKLGELSDRAFHGLVSDYVSQNDLKAIEGVDLLRLEDRFNVYQTASARGTIAVSPPVTLATGFKGFFSVLAVYEGEALNGWILTSFRYDDLMAELFTDESFDYQVRDISEQSQTELFTTAGFTKRADTAERKIEVGDRKWQITLTREPEERPAGYLLPAAIMTTALVLATTLYVNNVRRT